MKLKIKLKPAPACCSRPWLLSLLQLRLQRLGRALLLLPPKRTRHLLYEKGPLTSPQTCLQPPPRGSLLARAWQGLGPCTCASTLHVPCRNLSSGWQPSRLGLLQTLASEGFVGDNTGCLGWCVVVCLMHANLRGVRNLCASVSDQWPAVKLMCERVHAVDCQSKWCPYLHAHEESMQVRDSSVTPELPFGCVLRLGRILEYTVPQFRSLPF